MIVKFCKICEKVLTTREYERGDYCAVCEEKEKERKMKNQIQEDWA